MSQDRTPPNNTDSSEEAALIHAHLAAIGWIEAHLFEPMTVKSIADYAGYSASRFSRGFDGDVRRSQRSRQDMAFQTSISRPTNQECQGASPARATRVSFMSTTPALRIGRPSEFPWRGTSPF